MHTQQLQLNVAIKKANRYHHGIIKYSQMKEFVCHAEEKEELSFFYPHNLKQNSMTDIAMIFVLLFITFLWGMLFGAHMEKKYGIKK